MSSSARRPRGLHTQKNRHFSRVVQQACLSLLFILTNRYYEKEAVTSKEILTPTTNFQILPIKKDFEIVKYYPQAFFGFCSKYVSFGKQKDIKHPIHFISTVCKIRRRSNLTYFTHSNLQIFLPLMFYHFEMRTYIFNIFIEKYSEAYFENVHMIILIYYSFNTFRSPR